MPRGRRDALRRGATRPGHLGPECGDVALDVIHSGVKRLEVRHHELRRGQPWGSQDCFHTTAPGLDLRVTCGRAQPLQFIKSEGHDLRQVRRLECAISDHGIKKLDVECSVDLLVYIHPVWRHRAKAVTLFPVQLHCPIKVWGLAFQRFAEHPPKCQLHVVFNLLPESFHPLRIRRILFPSWRSRGLGRRGWRFRMSPTRRREGRCWCERAPPPYFRRPHRGTNQCVHSDLGFIDVVLHDLMQGLVILQDTATEDKAERGRLAPCARSFVGIGSSGRGFDFLDSV
mmetsp:Transcript_3218/g.8059  ORF Transcript_3218/g.8059 Transcript_3218/m.8059 type:complete len:285 (-) Transcript_3218:411-1265(-)